MTQAQKLIFEVLRGKADLVSPKHSITVELLDVKFDPRSLEFELFIDAEHPLVEELVDECGQTSLCLKNVELRLPQQEGAFRATNLCLGFRTPLSEWPEFNGFRQSDYADDEKPEAVRRVLLAPQEKLLRFDAEGAVLSSYLAFYSGWNMRFLRPSDVTRAGGNEAVHFDTQQADAGLICVWSHANFFDVEDRLLSVLGLAQGRNLKRVLKVHGLEYTFYGLRKPEGWQPLSMLKEGNGGGDLLDQLLLNAVALESEKFAKARLPLQIFLSAKQMETVEFQFLKAMMCVEAMDEVGELSESTTAALLGISSDAAKLLNCMRNKLVHGAGGYQQAFAQVFEKDFGSRLPDFGKGFETILSSSGELQFFKLWLRLLERLDAFWCAYLGVPAEMLRKRNVWFGVRHLPAIDSSEVLNASKSVKESREENKKISNALRGENQRLIKENLELKECLRNLRGATSG